MTYRTENKRVYDLICLRRIAFEQKEGRAEKNNPVGRQLHWTQSDAGRERCAARAEHQVEIFPSIRNTFGATRRLFRHIQNQRCVNQ